MSSFSKHIVWLQTILSRRVLGRLTVILVPAIAIACFWPFAAPRNSAAWADGGHAVAFDRHGILVGPDPLLHDGPADSGCTLELWVEPDRVNLKGAIFATYSAANPRLLTIEQYNDAVAVRSVAPGAPARTGGAQLYADGVFAAHRPVHLTVTSAQGAAKVFVNGIVRRAVPDFGVCRALFTGRFVVGTATQTDYDWRGKIAGIAVFDRALDLREIQEDYKTWPSHPDSSFLNKVGVAAFYRFDKTTGLRDLVSRSASFDIPDRFFVPAKRRLSLPSFDNHIDILANIIGFMPLGFTLCGYLSFRSGKLTSVLIAVLFCSLFSLLIESLQWYLPTRDSDLTDVISNTTGAAVGAMLLLWCVRRGLRSDQ
jgi:VanZ family protein